MTLNTSPTIMGINEKWGSVVESILEKEGWPHQLSLSVFTRKYPHLFPGLKYPIMSVARILPLYGYEKYNSSRVYARTDLQQKKEQDMVA